MSRTPPSLLDKLQALQARAPRGMVLGLDRVEHALAALGDPHRGGAFVHVAGSNGKGSTSAMLESIARAAGLRTGLTTSPHLCRFAERIRIDGEPIADAPFERALGAVLDGCRPDLTFFESLTVAAFQAFREARVDLAILEVGLGGRLDATNVIEGPIATAVTSISLEHTAILGETIDAIAREKAGIFKHGAPVVLGPLDPDAYRAMTEVASAVGAGPIVRVVRAGSPRRAEDLEVSLEGGSTLIHGPGDRELAVEIGLRGAHQAENAGVAVALAHRLSRRFPDRDWQSAVSAGLQNVAWPGRLERVMRGEVSVILDAAHNPDGIERLCHERLGDPDRMALVFGALSDKRWPEMLQRIVPLAHRRYFTEPKGRAPAPIEAMKDIAHGAAVADPVEAIHRAIAESRAGDTVLVTGSIYLVGEVRAALLGIEADPVIAL
jgi:dihydrofolate synthase / folylpolyglutamate synthase